MAFYQRIYGANGDGHTIQSHATYATCRNLTPAIITNLTSAEVGQRTGFTCMQQFFVFDTSAAPAGSGSADLSIQYTSAGISNFDTTEIRQIVGTPTTAVPGDTLSSLTLLGPAVLMPANATSPNRQSFALDPSLITRSSTCYVVAHGTRQRTATAPTTYEVVNYSFAEIDGATTTRDPYLTVLIGDYGWSFVGVSAVVETTTTTLTLTEPAGVAAGDLLVACISLRTSGTPNWGTLPSGWTKVGQQTLSSTATNTSAAPSAIMYYQVRGASAPTLAFTDSFWVPNPAIGRIVAYRGSAAAPLDVSTSVYTGTAITAVSVTGLTTTQDDDLIVAMCAGGQESAWTDFNTTTPNSSSGSTVNTAMAPIPGWIKRADTNTTTGNDTSLAIFDAVKETAGATGNFTATASISSGQVIIAGAFKIAVPPTADAWSNADKSANIALSASDKTATATTTTAAGVRSTTTYTNGTASKYYAEFVMGLTLPNRVGLSPTSNVLDATTLTAAATSSGSVVINNVSGVATLGTFVAGDVASMAWDAGAKQVWFRRNADSWNATGADPGGGTGGLDCSFAAATPHALWGRFSSTTTNSVTVRTELAEYTQAVPTGFLSWMGETPPTPGTADAWNYLDKSATITLSNSDKTASAPATGVSGVQTTARLMNGTAGKYYVECLFSTWPGGFLGFGLHEAAKSPTDTTRDVIVNASGQIYVNSANSGINVGTIASGDIISFAWDAGAELVWFRRNSGNWNNSGTADPATGAGSIGASSVDNLLQVLYWFTNPSATASATIRIAAADMTLTAPAGFNSWLGEALTVNPNATVNVTGLSVTASVGDETVLISVSVNAATNLITASVGNETILLPVAVNVSGQSVVAGSVGLGVGQSAIALTPPVNGYSTTELGSKIRFSKAGRVTHIRYWRDPLATGMARTTRLWDVNTQTQLTATSGADDGSITGWVTGDPINWNVVAGVDYMASVGNPDYYPYLADPPYPLVNGHVTVLGGAWSGGSGIGAYPATDLTSPPLCLFVDVIFRENSAEETVNTGVSLTAATNLLTTTVGNESVTIPVSVNATTNLLQTTVGNVTLPRLVPVTTNVATTSVNSVTVRLPKLVDAATNVITVSDGIVSNTTRTDVSTNLTGQSVSTYVGLEGAGTYPPPDAWDWMTAVPIGVDLTNGDMTVDVPDAISTAYIKSTTEWDTGKHYTEVTITGSLVNFRVGPANIPLTGGAVLHSTGYVNSEGTDGTFFPPLAAGDVVGIAYNAEAGKVWFRVNGGNWNNDPTQSPY